jgi:membrane-associated phospholipid phosphatase
MHFLAKWISRLGHPLLTYPLSMIALFGVEEAWRSLTLIFCISFGLPFLFFLWLFFSKKISDFDVSKRKERYPLYGISLLGMTGSLFFLYFTESAFIFSEFLRLFLLAAALVLLNFKIKVSVHAAMISILTILLVQFYSWSPWIFLLIPLIGTSRLILKRHSWLEVILGVILPAFIYLL